ncbi:MAG: single-stranded-DNA-specific exonuclease RecJ [Deltaproteobacteria bacterium]|nr:single-stranded-DNA-specific exonuclease RecJ [Deltaproteobacteria bacterium]
MKIKKASHDPARLASEAGLSPLQAHLLINRGITTPLAAASFLKPRLSQIEDPMLLEDMDAGVDLILRAVENRSKITIFGDFDADGLTATALLMKFFESMGTPVSFYIPDRLREGYGLNGTALTRIIGDGSNVIITVDCGTSNREEIITARNHGVEVVVTDHHQIPKDFEPACPVINPYRPNSAFPFRDLSGVGVVFYLAVAIRAALREKGWFRNRPEPDLKLLLDLVAVGTIADMASLLDQNRVLVKAGIERIKRSSSPGITALRESAGIDNPDITSDDVAFRIAPRLNAAGRMGDAEAGLMLLTVSEMSDARPLAEKLNKMNGRRRVIEQNILEIIDKTICATGDLDLRRIWVFAGTGWHRGVLGIVASRLTHIYHRPVLVLDIHNGMATGSGRSIDGFNLYNALSQVSPLLEKFGGHYHAAGLSLEARHIEALGGELEQIAQRDLSDEDLIPVMNIDARLDLKELAADRVRQIGALSPFGRGNPEPLFYAGHVNVVGSRVVGENHLKLRVTQGSHGFDCIGFGLGAAHPLNGKDINMVYIPEINKWQGRERVQLRIIDLEVASTRYTKLKSG